MRLYDWYSWLVATAVILGCTAVCWCVGSLLWGVEDEGL